MKKPLLTAFSLLFIALTSGCDEQDPRILVSPEPPTQAAQLSKVRAAVDQAKEDNTQNPDGPAKAAVDLQLGVAQSGLPESKVEDRAEPAELSALVFAGKLDEALTRSITAERALASLKDQARLDREAAAEQLRQVITKAETRVREAEAKAEREAYLAVVKVFAVIGGACVIVGLGLVVWTTYKRIGAMLIVAGPVIGGSGLLWGKPWFYLTVGIAVLIAGIASGIWWAIGVYEKRNTADQ